MLLVFAEWWGHYLLYLEPQGADQLELKAENVSLYYSWLYSIHPILWQSLIFQTEKLKSKLYISLILFVLSIVQLIVCQNRWPWARCIAGGTASQYQSVSHCQTTTRKSPKSLLAELRKQPSPGMADFCCGRSILVVFHITNRILYFTRRCDWNLLKYELHWLSYFITETKQECNVEAVYWVWKHWTCRTQGFWWTSSLIKIYEYMFSQCCLIIISQRIE